MKKLFPFVGLCILFSLTACKKDQCEPAEALTVSIDRDTLAADGIEFTTITATLCENADPTQWTLQFKAEGGSKFENDKDTIRKTILGDNTVSVRLKSAEKGTQTVTITVKEAPSVVRQVLVYFEPPQPTLRLVALQDSVMGDNVSWARVQVSLSQPDLGKDKKITLTLSDGAFEFPKDPANVKVREVEGDATTEVQIKKPDEGQIFLLATLDSLNSTLPLTFLSTDQAIILTVLDSLAMADGSDLVRMSVKLNRPELVAANEEIQLSVSNGAVFTNTIPAGTTKTVPANSLVPVEFTIRSEQPGTATMTAEYDGQTVFQDIYFEPVGNNQIYELVVTTTGPVPADNATEYLIEGRILQNPGQGTQNIEFSTTRGKFQNGDDTITLTADQNGVATARLKSFEFGNADITSKYPAGGSNPVILNETVQFSALPLNQVFTYTNTPGTGLADDYSEMELKVQVLNDLGGGNVNFDIDGTDEDKTPDALGYARLRRKSETEGTLPVLIKYGQYTLDTTITFQTAYPDYVSVPPPDSLEATNNFKQDVVLTASRFTGKPTPNQTVIFWAAPADSIVFINVNNLGGVSTRTATATVQSTSSIPRTVTVWGGVVIPGDTIRTSFPVFIR